MRNDWEEVYSADTFRNKNEYPSGEVVSFIMRNYGALGHKELIHVLDMGCGWGNNLKFLKDKGFCGVGVDISKTAVQHCKSSGYTASVCDFSKLPFSDSSFDIVFDRQAIQHNTIENISAISSVVLGASIIEKHVTLDRNGGGPDDSFSLESGELKELCLGAKTAWEALGQVDYGRKSSEQDNVKFRRSLYFVRDMKAGEIITKDHIKSIRPGYGLSPKYAKKILGKSVSSYVKRGDPVKIKNL